MLFSASMLRVWMDCPLKAKFRYVDKLPEPGTSYAVFGTVMHDALETLYNTKSYEEAERVFRKNWQDPSNLGTSIEVWPYTSSYQEMLERGLSMLTSYEGAVNIERRKLLGTEHYFRVPFGAHELHGYVDLLEATNREVVITDFKTAAKLPTKSELAFNIQFTVYDYASRQPEFWESITEEVDFENLDRRLCYYSLANSREIQVQPRELVDYKRMMRVCNEIEKALEHEVFVPDISGRACEYCPYHEPCGQPIERIKEIKW